MTSGTRIRPVPTRPAPASCLHAIQRPVGLAFQITSTLLDDFSPAGSLNPGLDSFREFGIEQEWRLEGEHGHAGVTDHVLGHAPQEHAGKPGATVRAQDDQVAVLLLGDPEDLRGGVPFDLDRLDGDAGSRRGRDVRAAPADSRGSRRGAGRSSPARRSRPAAPPRAGGAAVPRSRGPARRRTARHTPTASRSPSGAGWS